MTQQIALPERQFKKASQRKALRCLDRRGERLVELMTLGLMPEEAVDYPDVPTCEPLTLEQAAQIIGLKMKNARFIFASQPFLKAYSCNLMAIRNGHKARAVAVLAEVMNTTGEGLASDRAVRIKAAAQLLNDSDGRSGSQVNLQINNGGPALAPGIVIRLPASAPTAPLEMQESVA